MTIYIYVYHLCVFLKQFFFASTVTHLQLNRCLLSYLLWLYFFVITYVFPLTMTPIFIFYLLLLFNLMFNYATWYHIFIKLLHVLSNFKNMAKIRPLILFIIFPFFIFFITYVPFIKCANDFHFNLNYRANNSN